MIHKSKRLLTGAFIGVVILAIVAAIALVFILVVFKTSGPEKTVRRFIKAVETSDMSLFLTCYQTSVPQGYTPGQQIRMFLKDGLSTSDIQSCEASIKEIPGVRKVVYVSKEQALEKFKEWFPEEAPSLEGLGPDVLPAGFTITVESGTFLDVWDKLIKFPQVSLDDAGLPEVKLPLWRPLKTSGVEMKTSAKGQEATVTISKGSITEFSRSGKERTISIREPGVFPVKFRLRKIWNKWFIEMPDFRGPNNLI